MHGYKLKQYFFMKSIQIIVIRENLVFSMHALTLTQIPLLKLFCTNYQLCSVASVKCICTYMYFTNVYES